MFKLPKKKKKPKTLIFNKKEKQIAQFRKFLKIKDEDKKEERCRTSAVRKMRLYPAVKVDQMISRVSFGKN